MASRMVLVCGNDFQNSAFAFSTVARSALTRNGFALSRHNLGIIYLTEQSEMCQESDLQGGDKKTQIIPSLQEVERVFLDWLEDGNNRHSIAMGGVGDSSRLAAKMHRLLKQYP